MTLTWEQAVGSVRLETRKSISAPAERLFDAWTQPSALQQWWGPEGVTCTGAEIDLRIGGTYRIVNRLVDGAEVVIFGEFETIEPPDMLVFSWQIDPAATAERVTVRFEEVGDKTDVIVVHERIVDQATRDLHRQGWIGCLGGLDLFATGGVQQAH